MAMTMAGAGGGRFNLKQNSDINVTPFVDIMLVLLIVMMVTAPLATVAVKIDIPPPGAVNPAQRPPTFVSIADDGRLTVSMGAAASKPTSLDRLAGDVAASLGTADVVDTRVLIRADRHVTYGKFMVVINTLKLARYQHVGLITEEMRR